MNEPKSKYYLNILRLTACCKTKHQEISKLFVFCVLLHTNNEIIQSESGFSQLYLSDQFNQWWSLSGLGTDVRPNYCDQFKPATSKVYLQECEECQDWSDGGR